MKSTLLTAAAAALLASGIGAASAADLSEPAAVTAEPTVWDVAFGVAGVTDYRFRGVSQSKKDPAIQGYVELQAFDWVYAGVWASSVNFPAKFGLTDPSAEIDIYAGLRHTWGAFTLDVGYIYYYYPGESRAFPGQRQTDYWELKALPSVSLGDYGSITGNIWWSNDYANTGGDDLYVSLAPKFNIPISTIPDVGFYVAGELGKQWLGKTDFGLNPHNFWTWNVGGGVTYKAMTFDVRYSDTDLSKSECVFNTGARSWCGSTVIGKLSFDTSVSKLK